MEYKDFYERKKEIFCNICCVELLSDILNIRDDFNDLQEKTMEQLCELFSYVENKVYRKGKIDLLKFYRKINYKPLSFELVGYFKEKPIFKLIKRDD